MRHHSIRRPRARAMALLLVCGGMGCADHAPLSPTGLGWKSASFVEGEDVCEYSCVPITIPPPEVDAGPDQTVAPGGSFTLVGVVRVGHSLDDGFFGWQQEGGPSVMPEPVVATSVDLTAPLVEVPTVLTFLLYACHRGVTGHDDCDVDDVLVTVDPALLLLAFVPLLEQLIHDVNALHLEKNTSKSMTALLQNIIAALRSGDRTGAIDKLESFQRQVGALREKKVLLLDADDLIGKAEHVLQLLRPAM